jgi:hypothetical protein
MNTMSKLLSAASTQGHEAVHALLKAGGPLLIEVRYPGGVVSSDWHLCDSDEEYDTLMVRLNANAVLHVSRVWDLTNPTGGVCLRR